MKQHRILVVEDEASIRKILCVYLQNAGFEVDSVANGPDAIAFNREHHPDLILLDLNLPGMDGLEVALRLRETSDVYMLMLTARGEEEERILGLRLGADDYVAKPFSPREVVARVETILRRQRTSRQPPAILRFKQLLIDRESHEALVQGRPLELTLTEFHVLWELARSAGRVLPRKELLELVWGGDYYGSERVVDVYVGQVRRKMQEFTNQPLIETVRGVGYKFVDQEE